MKSKYYNCELQEVDAQKFKAKLKEENITYESSSAGFGYTHFEILCNDVEVETIDKFLMDNRRQDILLGNQYY